MIFSLPIFIAGPDVFATDDFREIVGFLSAMLIGMVTFILAMNMKSHIELHPSQIHYRDMVFSKKLKVISLDEIASYSIEKYSFFKYKGLGYKRDFNGNRYIIMRMGKVLEIRTKQGKKLVFGINDATMVKRFTDQNWNKTLSKNG